MNYNNTGNIPGNVPGNPSGNTPGNTPYGYMPPVRMPGAGLANAAMILGVASIITSIMMTLYIPFIVGSLAILLALLSKGTAAKLHGQARAALVCGGIGLAVNVAILASSLVYVLSNPEMLVDTAKMYDQVIEQTYGVPSEDLLGESMEDTINDMLDSR